MAFEPGCAQLLVLYALSLKSTVWFHVLYYLIATE